MKYPHGLARDILIDEQINKLDLLDEAVHNLGFENETTIELFRMKENGKSYIAMWKFYNEAMREEFEFEI